MKFSPVDEARKYLFVREAGENRGQRVEAIQHWSGGNPGDSWCCEFVWMVLDVCYQGAAPIPREQACEDVHALAVTNGWIVPTPQPGDLALSVTPEGHAHHIGIVTNASPLTTIAGNTSEDGISSNGDRVAEHIVGSALKVFVRLPV